MSKPLSISFSGGGWIGISYYFGVFDYLINNDIIHNQDIITLGTSCGSWAATFILYIKYNIDKKINKIKLKELKEDVYSFFDSMKNFPFMCSDKLISFFKKSIPNDDKFIKYIKDRLYISTSVNKIFYLKNKIINPVSYDELINSLITSSMIPGMVGKNFKNLDGGLTNNQPIHDKYTVKINCLYKYNADIYPDKFVNPIYIIKIPPNNIRNDVEKMGYLNVRNFFEADFWKKIDSKK